jgi:hypothetical protein
MRAISHLVVARPWDDSGDIGIVAIVIERLGPELTADERTASGGGQFLPRPGCEGSSLSCERCQSRSHLDSASDSTHLNTPLYE